MVDTPLIGEASPTVGCAEAEARLVLPETIAQGDREVEIPVKPSFGAKKSAMKQGHGLNNLSEHAISKVQEAFNSFDIDRSAAIDLDEALRHWGNKGFGKISAKAFFKTVDMDGNGEIEYDEFERFWKVVKEAGNAEEEIIEELMRIKNGESWVGFNNLPK